MGTYTGNGSDTRQFTAANGNGIGLLPEYLSVTRGSTTTSSPGTTTNVKVGATGASSDLSLLYYYASDAALTATNRIQQLLSDGFELGTHADVNASSTPYFYVAFAGANPSGAATTNYRSIGAAGSYSLGTIAVTNNSRVVTMSASSSWEIQWQTAKRGAGDVIIIGGVNYTVASVLAEDRLELTQAYAGSTNPSISYEIRHQFSTLQAWEDCISYKTPTSCPYFPVASANLMADNRAEVGVVFDGDFVHLLRPRRRPP